MSNLVISLMIVAVLSAAAVGTVFKANYLDNLVPVPQAVFNPNTQNILKTPLGQMPTLNQADTSTWKTYTNSQYGFELKFPAEYPSPQVFNNPGNTHINNVYEIRSNGVFEIKSEINIVIELVRGIYCEEFLCEETAKNKLIVNSINWDYLGLHRYCDAGTCSSERSVYRTTYGANRFYLFFNKENRESQTLSTFKFIK